MNSRQYVSWFNFKGGDQQKRVSDLSGGERNRLHLAKLLSSGGNVLLLDEPTNDLDVDTLRALEEALLDFAGCAVVISHDRWFLDRVATHILAFEGDSQTCGSRAPTRSTRQTATARLGAEAEQPHRLKYKRLVRQLSAGPLSLVYPEGMSCPECGTANEAGRNSAPNAGQSWRSSARAAGPPTPRA